MEHVCGMCLPTRNEQSLVIRKSLVVIRSCFLPRRDILVQMGQFGIQHGGLNTVQTTVDTNHVVMITHHHTVIGNRAHLSSQSVIVSEDGTAVPVAT